MVTGPYRKARAIASIASIQEGLARRSVGFARNDRSDQASVPRHPSGKARPGQDRA